MIPRHELAGLILAGGQGRRMQGSGNRVEKGLLPLGGAPLAQHAGAFLAPWVQRVYVSANRCRAEYARYGEWVPDDPLLGEQAGPLAGVASALARSPLPWMLVAPVDVPFLPDDLAPRLGQAVRDGARLAYARAGGRAHPLCMLAHRSLLEDLRSYLQSGGRKVMDWHARHGARTVDYAQAPGDAGAAAAASGAVPGMAAPDAAAPDPFSNINTPEDLVRAELRWNTARADDAGA